MSQITLRVIFQVDPGAGGDFAGDDGHTGL